jgi:cytochrome d ubiquinol oxidase subunit II
MISVVLATIALPLLWINLTRNNRHMLRFIAGFQTTMIVLGWFAIQFPVLVKINDGVDITVQSSIAPEQTQLQLLIALIVGVLVVFPYMGYLYKTFKFDGKTTDEQNAG